MESKHNAKLDSIDGVRWKATFVGGKLMEPRFVGLGFWDYRGGQYSSFISLCILARIFSWKRQGKGNRKIFGKVDEQVKSRYRSHGRRTNNITTINKLVGSLKKP